MICQGFRRRPHEVDKLHGKGLCEKCYQKKYRLEHKTEIIKYQQEYRADSAYAALNRLYVSQYRQS